MLAKSKNPLKKRFDWCRKLYSSAGAYSNHIQKKHPNKYPSEDPTSDHEDPTDEDLPLARRTEHILSTTQDYLEITEMDQEAIRGFEEASFPYNENSDTEESKTEDLESETHQNSDIEPYNAPNAPFCDAWQFTPHRVRQFPDSYGAGGVVRESPFIAERSLGFNYLHPFLGARDYKLARFFIQSKTPKTRIDQFFKDDILPPPSINQPTPDISFRSGYTMYKKIDEMIEDPPWFSGHVQFPLRPQSEFTYRDIIKCIKYLLRQRAFLNNMCWAPTQVFNQDGVCIYSELNTGSWWWEQQVQHPLTPNVPLFINEF